MHGAKHSWTPVSKDIQFWLPSLPSCSHSKLSIQCGTDGKHWAEPRRSPIIFHGVSFQPDLSKWSQWDYPCTTFLSTASCWFDPAKIYLWCGNLLPPAAPLKLRWLHRGQDTHCTALPGHWNPIIWATKRTRMKDLQEKMETKRKAHLQVSNSSVLPKPC